MTADTMDSVATSGVVATMTRKPRDDVAQWRGVWSLTCLGTENIAMYSVACVYTEYVYARAIKWQYAHKVRLLEVATGAQEPRSLPR